MAICNEMLIMMESVRLMKEGILKGSGKFTEAEINGKIERFEIPEEIHTYNKWKELGFQVQKGETSFIKFRVWYFRKGRQEQEIEGDAAENSQRRGGKCYLKMTAFFTADQVKPR